MNSRRLGIAAQGEGPPQTLSGQGQPTSKRSDTRLTVVGGVGGVGGGGGCVGGWGAGGQALHTRFDLKGSTLGRTASAKERSKGSRAILKARQTSRITRPRHARAV